MGKIDNSSDQLHAQNPNLEPVSLATAALAVTSTIAALLSEPQFSAAGTIAAYVYGFFDQSRLTSRSNALQEGLALITDDCLVLERREGRIVAVPSYPGVRLWPDSATAVLGAAAPAGPSITHYSKKQRIWSGNRFRFCNGLPAVWRVYVLASPDDRRSSGVVTVMPMPLRDALVELLRFTYYLDVNNRNAAGHAFDLLGDLAGSVESRRLTYPWDLSRLNELSRAVVTDLALI